MPVGNVKFAGAGPYYLRAVEHATANVLDSTIQLTLYALVDSADAQLVRIETQMTSDAAQDLARALWRAAGESLDEPKN